MGKSAWSGPVVSFGTNTQAPGQDYNGDAGPSAFFDGASLLDPRPFYTYVPGRETGVMSFTSVECDVINQVPSQLATTNIAAAAAGVVGNMALVGATGAGITVGASITNPNTGQLVTGLLAIDGATAIVSFGSNGFMNAWDSRSLIARNIRLNSAGADTGGTATVHGFDIYGVPMTEAISLGTGAVSGKKAFKYVQSIALTGTLSGSNISAGTGDVIGFPIRVDQFAYASIFWNSAIVTATAGFTAPDATTASAITGDVRGTWALQTAASNGTLRLMMEIIVPAYALALGQVGLFGVTQF